MEADSCCFDVDNKYYYPDDIEGTTWVKPVPWDGIDKDEKDEIEKEIEIRKAKHFYYDPDSTVAFSYPLEMLLLKGCRRGEYNFVVGPVFQVISVTILNEIDPTWKEFKISGEISIRDDKNNVFYMYDREKGNAEAVSFSNNSLSLKPCHFAPVMRGNVKFNLTKDDGDQIFDVESVVEYKIKDGLENHRINGKHGYYALMIFTIIPYASIAKVEMFIHDTDTYIGNDETFGVYGHIKGKSSNVHGKLKEIEVVCFEKRMSEPVTMWHGQENHIEMSTPVFAVSVFSPLNFDISLWFSDGTKLALDEIEDTLGPGERVISDQVYYCDNEDFQLRVCVEWFSPSQFFELKEYSFRDARVEWNRGCRQQMDHPTDFPLLDDRVSKKTKKSPFSLVGQIGKALAEGTQLVEIFSILVEGGDSASPPLSLCGSIVLRHQDETLYIFSRSKKLSDKLSSNEQGFRRCVSLAWSDKSWVEEERFLMHLKLKDDKDNEVCRGTLKWVCGPLRLDRRLCEIIPGKYGHFAAVHYSVFTNGLRAKVTVECYGRVSVNFHDKNCISVYGSIFAEYSNYDYSSAYDKEYYRSIIFKRSAEDRIFVKNGGEIPLSKSRLCAPSGCNDLIVEVDLFVEVHPFSPDPESFCPFRLGPVPLMSFRHRGHGHAFGRIPFKTNMNVVRIINGYQSSRDGCSIRVRVQWF